MSTEQRPEKPTEYDRRMSAPLDFDPSCEAVEFSVRCDLRASQRASCAACGFVLVLLCGAHGGRSARASGLRVRTARCGACGAKAPERDLLAYAPLWGRF